MTNYKAAIKLPFSDWKKFFIGAGIFAFAYLMSLLFSVIPYGGVFIGSIVSIILSAVALGYILYCAKNASEGKLVLPEWENWGNLFVKGLLSMIVSLVYTIPYLIFGGILFFTVLYKIGPMIIMTSAGSSGRFAPGLTLATLGFGVTEITLAVLAFVFVVLAYYLIPMAWVKLINEGFWAAFNLKDVFRRTFTTKYLLGILAIIGITIVIGIIATILIVLLLITVIGPLIIYGLTIMVLYVIIMAIVGQIYRETSAMPSAAEKPKKTVRKAKKKK